MAYLQPGDYTRLIQDTVLTQVVSTNAGLTIKAEAAAITEAKSYLSAKYDVDKEFTDTTVYSPVAAYSALSRVYLNANFYNPANTYALNALVLYQGNVYKCINAIIAAEEFTVGNWQLLGARYDIFYAKLPNNEFNLYTVYKKGDIVFYKNKVYTAVLPTTVTSHETAIQYSSISSVPNQNVLPDDPTNGSKYWGAGVTYTVPANNLLNTTYFTSGDNRNQQLVMFILDIIIYNLYRRIPPAIVPEIRERAYHSAIAWFKAVAKNEDVQADIAKKQPKSGSRILYGSRPRQDNW